MIFLVRVNLAKISLGVWKFQNNMQIIVNSSQYVTLRCMTTLISNWVVDYVHIAPQVGLLHRCYYLHMAGLWNSWQMMLRLFTFSFKISYLGVAILYIYPTIRLSNTCMYCCSAVFICSQTCDNSAPDSRRLKIDSKKDQFYTRLPYSESLRLI